MQLHRVCSGIARELLRKQASATPGRAGCEQRVSLHLVPFGLSAERARERLESVVQTVEQEVASGVDRALGTTPAKRVMQDVGDYRPVVAVPYEGEREALNLQHRLAVVGDALQRAFLVHETTVRVEHQAPLRPTLRDAGKILVHDLM